ncbi:hypothetical protein G6038_14970 [Rhodococcus sp. 14C212]|uniref:hypothetical protein n=1 Tax=Rhodococcus sp. 14C212 TaxID=2711209 RepID=UPI0013E9F9D5|nr:hypothetical protein [Rhodococcus sp. 14C212]NGP06759.1 hypothetical protein [Rhodococcus sp. 14C212]
MKLGVGARLRSQVCSTQVVVVRTNGDDHKFTCGGHPLVPLDSPMDTSLTLEDESDTGNLVGKRYVNASRDFEVLITSPGAGALIIDGESLQIKQAKPLPSSD